MQFLESFLEELESLEESLPEISKESKNGIFGVIRICKTQMEFPDKIFVEDYASNHMAGLKSGRSDLYT